jgi:glycosyltransferase involved in cell wall biosynthesis
MRALWVLSELRASGAEVMASAAADEWRRLGVDLEILSTGSSEGDYANVLRDRGYRVHHLPLTPFRRFAFSYHRLLRRGRYDVVHIHQEKANFEIGVLSRAARIPRVVRSINAFFKFDGALRLQRTVQRALLRKLSVRHVSISPTLQSNEIERFRNPSQLVYCWFDAASFTYPSVAERAAARQVFGLSPRQFVVTSVGNCAPVKNHHAILRALTQVEAPFVYLHAGTETGDGDERLLASELGLGERVRFLGHVDNIPQLLQASDAYVMPSLHEGLGVAALEAIATGLPAVLADVPGLRDLGAYFPEAWWVDPKPGSIARAIADIAGRATPPREREGRALSMAAREHFGPARLVPQLVRVYGADRGMGA